MLQGNLFRKFRDLIIGLQHISTLKRETILPEQECVGNNDIIYLNRTITTDIRRFTNMDENKNGISIRKLKHKHEMKSIPMQEVHGVPETRTCHRKSSYVNIVRGR